MSEEQKDQMKWAVKNGDLAAAKALIAAEASLASDGTPSISSFLVNPRTLMGCTDPYEGDRRTPSVSSRVGSKLPLPIYADVRHSDD